MENVKSQITDNMREIPLLSTKKTIIFVSYFVAIYDVEPKITSTRCFSDALVW